MLPISSWKTLQRQQQQQGWGKSRGKLERGSQQQKRAYFPP
jgi:hypothetical protein